VPGLGFAKEGDMPTFGVGTGVAFADEVAVGFCWACDADAKYGWPNSPGANDSVEQNPSDELIINVRPSFDL
jgi:hypothetical protein